jgi:UDP-N-acetylglucosamine 2-epimerase
MSWSSIRSALKARLEGISGVGAVHTYLRYCKDAGDSTAFAAIYVSGGQLNYWAISRTARRTAKSVDNDSSYRRQHDVEVSAFYAHRDADASENTFQDLLETVCNNLETGDHTLGSACLTHTPPEVRQIGHAMLGDVFCHFAVLALSIEEVT